MVRMRILFIILWWMPAYGWGQADTTYLKEVQVTGSEWREYLAGTKMFSLDSAIHLQSAGQNLGEILAQNTGIHIKSYGGSGQLSTIAFRGSSASHTAVLWNGLPIHSPNLGQSDLSLLPLTGVDKVSWQHGAGSAFYGSGAVGGTIIMRSVPRWGEGFIILANQGISSFGRHYGNIQLGHSGTRLEISTKAYYQRANNNFKVTHQNHHYRQPNAKVSKHGFSQRLSYKLGPTRQLFVEGWYQANDRQLQPVIGDLKAKDHLLDRQLRTVLHYEKAWHNGILNFNTGYLYDYQRFNNQIGLHTSRWVSNADYHRDIKPGLALRLGGQLSMVRSKVPQYMQEVKESRGALFGSLTYSYGRWLLAFNIRQSWVQGFKVPFTPSFGTDIALFKGIHNQLKAKLLLSKSYRDPSLNDRFWQPGGNLNLLPEEGLGAETSLVFERTKNQIEFDATVTYYHNRIKNWIIWIPGGSDENTENTSFWYPENIREVKSRGVEVHWQWKLLIRKWVLTSGVDYAFTKTTNEKKIDQFDRSKGKQLPFVPKHRISWRMRVAQAKWAGTINVYNTGKRYIETNNESPSLPSYTLVDAGISRAFHLGSSRIDLTAGLNNIFNLDYRSMSLRAMPGRSYRINMNFQLKQKSKHESL